MQLQAINTAVVAVARKAVKLVHEDDLEVALRRVLNHLLKSRTVICRGRSRTVDVLVYDNDVMTFRELPDGAHLRTVRVFIRLRIGFRVVACRNGKAQQIGIFHAGSLGFHHGLIAAVLTAAEADQGERLTGFHIDERHRHLHGCYFFALENRGTDGTTEW